MRIQGRTLRPADLAQRRVLKSLGVDELRVPRRMNPFAVARHIRRLAAGKGGDVQALRALVARRQGPPLELPDSRPNDDSHGHGEDRAA